MYNQQEYHDWYIKNTDLKLKRVNARLKLIKEWYRNYKIGKKCKTCKIIADSKHLKFFHFHHKDPETKEYDVTDMVSAGFSVKRIKEEMKKCVFLCSECHHDIT